ncbi:MAG: hypothetical protein Q8933_20090 [Bacteroidota bacterium]|nr:hypothetical protein [Bacteroidota bacterium]
MQCPKCKRDYKDVKEDKDKGYFTQQNDHYYKPYRMFGFMCPSCGFHATVFSIPTMVPFVRSGRSHGELNRIVAEFQQRVIDYSEKHHISAGFLFEEENEK